MNLTKWFEQASPEQRKLLNDRFGRVSLSQLRADPGKNYHRGASADRAGEIEAFVAGMENAPEISRGDLCDACNHCEYWRKEHDL